MIRQPYLKRSRVEKKLENIFKYPLTIICASRGYGKTTSVRNFLEDQKDVRTVWFTVPDYIIDEVSLCKKLCKTIDSELQLKKNKNRIGKGFLNIYTEWEMIIDEIQRNFRKQSVLVIDDYHFNTSKMFERLIEVLVESCIPMINVVIIGWGSPKIKYEIDKHCYILHQEFLNFENEEIDELFAQNGVELSNTEKKLLYNYTDGWSIAVYLSLYHYYKNKEINPNASIESLILELIYEQFNEEEKQALIMLCCMDSFTREQATYVVGGSAATKVIDRLWKDRCFIYYDKLEASFYLHNLIKTVIMQEYSNTSCCFEIYKHNGDWYLEQKAYVLAIEQYYKACCFDKIYEVIENTYSIEYVHFIPQIIHSIFESMNNEQKKKYPIAYISLICSYMFIIDEEIGKQRLWEAKEFFKANECLDNQINGEIHLLEGFANFNDFEAFSKNIEETIRYFGEASSRIFNNKIALNFGVPCILYLYHKNRRKMKEIAEIFDNMIVDICKITNGCVAGAGFEMKAEYYIETGDYSKAEELAMLAHSNAITNQQESVSISSQFLLARLSILKGDFEEAIAIFEKMEESSCLLDKPSVASQIEMSVGYGYGIIGEANLIPLWIKEYDITKSKAMLQGAQACYIMFGVAMILNKDFSRLEAHSMVMEKAFETNRNLYRLVYSYLFSAISKYHMGKKYEAKAALMAALTIAQDDKMELPFIELSPHYIDLLSEVSFENHFSECLLGRCLKFTYQYKAFNSKVKRGLLSHREEEVMEILSKGYKQLYIGEKLNISLATVKTHIKNIYNKLGVDNKTDALKLWEQYYISR